MKREKDKVVIGFFPEPDQATRAIAGLIENGLCRETINALSSVPYPEGHFGTDNRKSFLPFFPLVGGVLGLMLNGLPFSVSAGVGFVALSGIAVSSRGAEWRARYSAIIASYCDVFLKTSIAARIRSPTSTIRRECDAL